MNAKTKDKPKKAAAPEAVLVERPPLPARGDYLLSLADIAVALRTSLRHVKGMVARGEYPAPDVRLGKLPRWTNATHDAWIAARVAGDPWKREG